MPRIAVVITCHNRRSKTVACLRALLAQEGVALRIEGRESKVEGRTDTVIPTAGDLHSTPATPNQDPQVSALDPRPSTLDLFLTDDGSTDGTADAVREIWPEATIIQGDGNLYWCGGMRVAWAEAAKTDPDFYLLVNDDTIMYPNALHHLLNLVQSAHSSNIAIAAIKNPLTNQWIYGGMGKPTNTYPPPDGCPQQCSTMHANCVIVPRSVYKTIGMFYHFYTHAMGDMDYGYTATKAGITLFESPEFLGECFPNSISGSWRDTSLPRFTRLKRLAGKKSLPPLEWFTFCRRNVKPNWFLYFCSPYYKVLFANKSL